MGFLSNLVGSAGSTLGSNLAGGHNVKVKTDVKGETKVAEKKAELEAKKNLLHEINEIELTGSNDEISDRLLKLITLYKQVSENVAGQVVKGILSNHLSSFTKGKTLPSSESDNTKAAICEKLEYGIMKLKKTDTEMAEYFQKKLDELRAQ